jgi:lipopolysaccharide export system ATP-binding protein
MSAPASAPSEIRTENLAKTYGDRAVVNGVSLHFRAGEVVGLLGPNGAGKTTTFYMVVGLVPASAGRVQLDGDDITRLRMHQRARRGIGYLPQEASVFRKLTVEENILAIVETAGVPRRERRQRVQAHLDELHLGEVAKQKAYTLSGGERRRLEIARSLVHDPTLLLLDEPFAGVDPITVQEIQNILERLVKERRIAILLTDHNVRETLAITDRSYIIADGKILRHGTPAALVRDEVVRRTYLGEGFSMPELEGV